MIRWGGDELGNVRDSRPEEVRRGREGQNE